METPEFKQFKKQIDDLTKGMEEIRKAILGDAFNENGYSKRLNSMEARLDSVEDFITKWKWIVVGAVGLGGYGGLTFIEQVIELISNTAHKH